MQLDVVEAIGEASDGVERVRPGGVLVRVVGLERDLVDPDDVEVLEDLVVAAVNDAKGKVEAQVQEETQRLMGGMKLPPGMKLPF